MNACCRDASFFCRSTSSTHYVSHPTPLVFSSSIVILLCNILPLCIYPTKCTVGNLSKSGFIVCTRDCVTEVYSAADNDYRTTKIYIYYIRQRLYSTPFPFIFFTRHRPSITPFCHAMPFRSVGGFPLLSFSSF